jgi:hypothetical protein
MSKSSVDANYRFIAAYQEVNARIAQRQQALALYVTLVVSLLAALVALGPGQGKPEPPIEWLILGFPVASICLAMLNYKSERAISNLREFLAELERLDNAHASLPSYNTDPRWSAGANKARRFHDLAAAILAIGGNAIGLGAAWKIYPQRLSESFVFFYGSIFLALVSLVVILATSKWSYRPATGQMLDQGS